MKDFDSWNKTKKIIDAVSKNKLYRVRDVWWCSLGINIGTEQSIETGKFQRPVVIIKSLGKNACIILPLTTSSKNHRFRLDLGLIKNKNAKAILSQIKVIDTKRLVNKIDVLEKNKFNELIKAVRCIF